MLQIIGLIAGLLAFISYMPYTKDVLAGKAKPERATWLIWGVLTAIAFFSQLSKGARQSLYFNGLDCLGALFIFFLAIRFGMGGLTRRDIVALILAGIGLIVWYFTHNAVYALLISMAIDSIGATLTVWKTLEHPDTETYPMWLIVSAGGILATISVGKKDFTLLAYPFYIFLANFAVVIAIFFGRRLKKSSTNSV